MKNLRRVAAALLMLPILALNANPLFAATLPGKDEGAGLSHQAPASMWCWIIINGRWYYVPC